MDYGKAREALISVLESSSLKESSLSSGLRRKTTSLIKSQEPANPDVCLDLLTNIVRPLFSTTKHAALTSSGRKNLLPAGPSGGRFSGGFEDEEPKPWKNGWTVPLLTYILLSYSELPEPERKGALDAQFHLLVPPILNTIDDAEIKYKTEGCRLLRLLSQAISSAHSDILKRTGLTDVFVGALKANFMLLPTLTPEDKSLALLAELYPAFRALVAARFWRSALPRNLDASISADTPGTALQSPAATSPSSTLKHPTANPETADRDSRQALLDLLMRHGILAAHTHTAENINISTFLLTQASHTVSDMGIYAAKHLQKLLPLLTSILSNPFGAASPDLLLAAVGLMKTLVEVCWPRIRDVWWTECLRGCVAGWMLTREEIEGPNVERLGHVGGKVQELVALLGAVVDEEKFLAAKNRLIDEEEHLSDLFIFVQSSIPAGRLVGVTAVSD